MFTLPQPTADSSKSHMNVDSDQGDGPIINIQEDAETMRQLLTLIHPCQPNIRIPDMTLARQVHLLATARKYIFEAIVLTIADNLSERAQRIPSDAFTIYAVGRVFDLNEVVRVAGASCLKLPASQLEVLLPQNEPVATEDSLPGNPGPTSLRLSIERQGLRDVLTQFSMLDYQDLLKLYWKRVAAVRKVAGITMLFPLARAFQKDKCRWISPETGLRFNSCLNERIIPCIQNFLRKDLESHGPDLELLLDSKFLFDRCNLALCGPCSRAIVSATGAYRVDLEKFVKRQMDCLPTPEVAM
jgi:hypothetical protein